ncbi:MAG: hypothetical protein E7279_08000 [Lachnospiraceae bacterium]|nr:hypothetical protein [Lachnospiraceae bacterium]
MAERMEIKVEGLEDILSGLDKRKEYVAKAVNSTCKEFKTRGPGWISKAVTQEYTIKAGEVKDAIIGKHSIGHITLGGVTLEDIYIEYSGRVLSYSHFRFTPRKSDIKLLKKQIRIPGQRISSDRPFVWMHAHRNQNVKVEVHKGRKKVLKGKYMSTPFIASMNGSPDMPFQRTSQKSQKVRSIRSVSIPQMITNEKVAKDISERVSTELGKRLQHHLDRYSNK